jgi:hypothetical protein
LLYLLYDKQVSQLESDVAVERSNVKNEEERVKLEKERHNERVKVLTLLALLVIRLLALLVRGGARDARKGAP